MRSHVAAIVSARRPYSEAEIELRIGDRLERPPVKRRWAEGPDCASVVGRDVADVLLESEPWVPRGNPAHEPVARDLRDDRRRGDRGARAVAPDHGAVC